MNDYTELINDLQNGGLHGFSIVLKAADAIERLQLEKDAAMKDLSKCGCEICRFNKCEISELPCRDCFHRENFEWRSVQDGTD